jgi:hypothetical protein
MPRAAIQAGSTAANAGRLRSPTLPGGPGRPGGVRLRLVTWPHRLAEPGSEPPLRHVPFLLRSQQRTKGIFATRGPKRINPMGLSLIQIIEVTGRTIRFAGVDRVEGTPVIDLKPYVTRLMQVSLRQDARRTCVLSHGEIARDQDPPQGDCLIARHRQRIEMPQRLRLGML